MPTPIESAESAERTARQLVAAEIFASSHPLTPPHGHPPTPLPAHLLAAGITTDSRAAFISTMAMFGLVSLTFEPGCSRRLTAAQARELAARLQLAAEHAEAYPE